jgi:hypothetical protein
MIPNRQADARHATANVDMPKVRTWYMIINIPIIAAMACKQASLVD